MTRPADQHQRDQALDTGRSWIVQAPAGSGKTELLTQRYLKLLGQVSRPERVLAVTFTRKATREMRQRVMDRLLQAGGMVSTPIEPHEQIAVDLARRVLEQSEQLGWNLVQNPNRLRISTIDSFCAELASRQPLLAGNSWHLAVTENAMPMYRAAAQHLLLDPAAGSGDIEAVRALERVLVFMEGKADSLCELLAAMLSKRDQWAKPESIGETDLIEFKFSLATVQQKLLDQLSDTVGTNALQQAVQWLVCVGGSCDEKTNPAAVRICELMSAEATGGQQLLIVHLVCKALLTAAGKLRKPGGITRQYGFPVDSDDRADAVAGLRSLVTDWNANPEAMTMVEAVGQNIPVLPGQDGLRLLEDLKLLLRNCLAYLNVEFDEQGRCDFLSVSEAASQALGSEDQPSDVLLSEDNRISHILMDEFQDTNRSQFALLEKLIAGWEPGDGRSLFLVGDPMQSIYGFREAEVGLFIKICKAGHLGPIPVYKLTLRNNFRSNIEILDWVNQLFPEIFPATENAQLGAVSYTPFLPHKGEGGSVDMQLLGPDRDELAEAADIAVLIQRQSKQNPGETIAVLARSKKLLTPIARALLKLRVKFEAVDADPLELRPVILDLLSLSRALSHPLDRIAWISLLRAPWCGLNLAEIHLLLGDDTSLPVVQHLEEKHINATLAGESALRVQKLRVVMQHAQALRGLQPLSRRVEVCWLRLGGPGAVLESAELDNARVFLQCLDELEQEQVDDPVTELRQRLADLYARNSRHCMVQLMSIHKAKGLEFDRVIIPGADRRPGGGRDQPLVRWQRYPDGKVLIAPRDAWQYEGNSLYRYLKQEHTLRESYETRRILYVAVTRARRHLHIFGRIKQGKNGVAPPASGSFLKLLWPGLAASISDPEVETIKAATRPPVYPLLRLKQLPVAVLEPCSPDASGDQPAIEWHIPDPGAIALGKALHLWLEIAHNNPQAGFSEEWLDARGAAMTSSLRAFGADESELAGLLPQLEQAVKHALCSEAGQAIVLPATAGTSVAELAIRVKNGKSLKKHVIDRLDVTGGICTITDYKTGSADTGQMEKWRKQLARYAELAGALTGQKHLHQQIYHPQDRRVYHFNDED